jgi:hypothetical protein
MKSSLIKGIVLLSAGFGAGFVSSHFPAAIAADRLGSDIAHKRFYVSIDEIKQKFVFADRFTGHYAKTVTLSDGSTRHIVLTPMMHAGLPVLEFKDNAGKTYMGLNSTSIDGKLLVQVYDADQQDAEFRSEMARQH